MKEEGGFPGDRIGKPSERGRRRERDRVWGECSFGHNWDRRTRQCWMGIVWWVKWRTCQNLSQSRPSNFLALGSQTTSLPESHPLPSWRNAGKLLYPLQSGRNETWNGSKEGWEVGICVHGVVGVKWTCAVFLETFQLLPWAMHHAAG